MPIITGSLYDNLNFGRKKLSKETYERLRFLDKFTTERDIFEPAILENGNNLSGGDKQKIALARAYVSNKKIFVLDESLSAIDADSARDILIDLLSRKDITLIMISHGTEQSVLDRFTKVIQL